MFDFDRGFDRHSTRIRNLMIFALIAKLAIFAGLIWLDVYAIKAFSA